MEPQRKQPPRWGTRENARQPLGLSDPAFELVKHKLPAGAIRREGGRELFDLNVIAELARRDGCFNGVRTAPGGETWG